MISASETNLIQRDHHQQLPKRIAIRHLITAFGRTSKECRKTLCTTSSGSTRLPSSALSDVSQAPTTAMHSANKVRWLHPPALFGTGPKATGPCWIREVRVGHSFALRTQTLRTQIFGQKTEPCMPCSYSGAASSPPTRQILDKDFHYPPIHLFLESLRQHFLQVADRAEHLLSSTSTKPVRFFAIQRR